MVSTLKFQEAPEEKSVPARDWPPLLNSTVALARLDERLTHAPSPVLEGWTRRALVHEAAASLRLDGYYVTAQDLMLALHDSLDRAGDPDLGRAVAIHQMLQALIRRNPKNLFEPRRLMALARLRLRSGPAAPESRMPSWLRERMPNPETAQDVLDDALAPGAVAGWVPLPALAGCAAVIGRWHNSGAADRIGGAGGRALAMAWARRAGLTPILWLLPSIGFLGRAYDYRPDIEGAWTGRFLDACGDAVSWGPKLEGHLRGTYRRLQEAAPRRAVLFPDGGSRGPADQPPTRLGEDAAQALDE